MRGLSAYIFVRNSISSLVSGRIGRGASREDVTEQQDDFLPIPSLSLDPFRL